MKRKQLLTGMLAMLLAITVNAAEDAPIVINLSTVVDGEYIGYKVEYKRITITANGDYIMSGTTQRVGEETFSTEKQILIEDGLAVNLTLDNVSIINESQDCIDLYAQANVTLILKGSNRLYSRDGIGIGLTSSTMTIKGSGSDARLVCESPAQGIGSGASTFTIKSGTVISYGWLFGMSCPYSTFTVNDGLFIGVSVDKHISGIDAQIVCLDLQEAPEIDTELTLYQGTDKVATFNLPTGYKKIDFSATASATYCLKADGRVMGSDFTAGNLYTVSLQGSGIETHILPTTGICTIYSIDGRLVRTVDLQSTPNPYDALPAGVYLIDGQKVIVREK